MNRLTMNICLTALLLGGALAARAANTSETVAPVAVPVVAASGVDTQMQTLKDDVLDLNRELFMLEEELLFPANTQVAVFLSMDVGEFFALDSVQLKVDGREVTNYLYTPKEADALLNQITSFSVERVGIKLRVHGVAIENASGDAAAFAARVAAVSETVWMLSAPLMSAPVRTAVAASLGKYSLPATLAMPVSVLFMAPNYDAPHRLKLEFCEPRQLP